jgi:hypothetical protein
MRDLAIDEGAGDHPNHLTDVLKRGIGNRAH